VKSGPLGANPLTFTQIVAGQVVLAPILGEQLRYQLEVAAVWSSGALPAVVTLAAAFMSGGAWYFGPALLRLWMVFAAISFGLALASPGQGAPWLTPTVPAWHTLALAGPGDRYFLYPMLTWIAVLVCWAAALRRSRRRTRRWARRAVVALLATVLLLGIPSDWEYYPFDNLHWPEAAARFERAPVGARVTIPLNPPGWSMTLVKRSST
ncbi:MAG: hypothetical protein WCB86_00880, partial [Candidatus Dormiibacterota bacterium]